MQQLVGKTSRKEVEWRQRLARFAACGQQVKPFCQAELVSEATFYRWRKQLAAVDGVVGDAGFIDAGVLSAPRPAHSPTPDVLSGAALEVRLDLGHGLVLHITRR